MSPALFQAIIAGATFFVLCGSTLVGITIWIINRIDRSKQETIDHFDARFDAVAKTIEPLTALVIRHDVMLNAEFGEPQHNGRHSHLRR